jgi:ribosomal-protein-alanine N-acetyltransferase
MTTIRPAGPEDAGTVHSILSETMRLPWSRDAVESELVRNPAACILLAEEGEEEIGCIHWWTVFDEIQIMKLAVRPAFRRRGIARLLLDAAVRAARTEGAAAVVLEVREGNTPAVALYTAAGFRMIAIRRGYYEDTGENALFMRLDVSEKFDFSCNLP